MFVRFMGFTGKYLCDLSNGLLEATWDLHNSTTCMSLPSRIKITILSNKGNLHSNERKNSDIWREGLKSSASFFFLLKKVHFSPPKRLQIPRVWQSWKMICVISPVLFIPNYACACAFFSNLVKHWKCQVAFSLFSTDMYISRTFPR